MRGVFLTVGLALCLAPPAGAISQAYSVDPGSQFTPAGGQAEAISGGFAIEPAACCLFFRFPSLNLAGPTLDLTLTPRVPIPGLLEPLADLNYIYPDRLDMRLVVERTTLPPQFQGEQRFRDLVLRASSAGPPANQFVVDMNYSLQFPKAIALDLELIQIDRLLIFDPVVDHLSTLSTTTLGTISLTATPVPEPGTALLLAVGLALLVAFHRAAPARF